MEKFAKLDRFAAWILFLGIITYFITGYGILKGVISSDFASQIHLGRWLAYLVAAVFVFHTFFAINLAFTRWGLPKWFRIFILVCFYGILLTGFIYVNFFYKIKTSNTAPVSNTEVQEIDDQIDDRSTTVSTPVTTPSTPTKTTVSTPAPTQTTTPTTQTQKTFTLSQLAQYNGKNGQPAYVAVDGKVYDLSAVFTNGVHFSHLAGQELTNAFYTKHAKQALAKYPIVGVLKK